MKIDIFVFKSSIWRYKLDIILNYINKYLIVSKNKKKKKNRNRRVFFLESESEEGEEEDGYDTEEEEKVVEAENS